MPTLSEAQAAQSLAFTTAYKAKQNRDAARLAALIALYYQQRVDPASADSVEAWLDLLIPRLILGSDNGARDATNFFTALRRIELGVNASTFEARATLGTIDAGVRKSLLTVGPYDYMNKASKISALDVGPLREKALLAEAKQAVTKKLAAAVVRHAQAGSRQTIFDNAGADPMALGYIRVTRAKPCYFCAALASRGLQYRAYTDGAFDLSNARFTGDGSAKVHDECGCSLKAVYAKNDPLVDRSTEFADMWSMWGAGGGSDAMLRFRRGYDNWRNTGDYLTFDQVSSA